MLDEVEAAVGRFGFSEIWAGAIYDDGYCKLFLTEYTLKPETNKNRKPIP